MIEMDKDNIIYASFCGTGKSYLCNKFPKKCIEFECWKYTEGDFPHNYVEEIKKQIGKKKVIFISTNPIVLKELHEFGLSIVLVYPKNNLKKLYLERFVNRDSSEEFIDTLNKNWDNWINELKRQAYCNHLVLSDGQYLEDVLIIK